MPGASLRQVLRAPKISSNMPAIEGQSENVDQPHQAGAHEEEEAEHNHAVAKVPDRISFSSAVATPPRSTSMT